MCAENRGELFWVVDDDDLSVTVTDLRTIEIDRVYKSGSDIPINVLGVEATLPVSEIFHGIVD